MLAQTLEDAGYSTLAVADGARALEILSGENAPPLAILDWTMPGLDGATVCRRVRALPGGKFFYLILLTSRTGRADIVAGLNAGADDYLTKPFDDEELFARLQAGERIVELQKSLAARVNELEAALDARERAERDLSSARERQRLLESAVEQADVAISVASIAADAPPEIVFANSALVKMIGFAPAETTGKRPNYAAHFLDELRANRSLPADLTATLAAGQKLSGEIASRRKDGAAYSLEWSISPVKNDVGTLTHFTLIQRDITQRKRTEEMLRESHEYRNLFNVANDSIVVFDPTDQIVLNVNDKACESYQIPRASFVGMSLKYVSLEHDRERTMLGALLEQGAIEEFETTHLRADGSEMKVLINSSVVEYEKRTAIMAIIRDVTERYRAEQDIRRAKQEWTETVDAVSDLIVLGDAYGRVRRCNLATAQFFKQSSRDLIGQPLERLFWHLDAFGAARPIQILNDKQTGDAAQISAQTSVWEGQIGGREDWFEITNHPVSSKDKTDETGGWVHIVKNITARKQSEVELLRLTTALEQAADGILIVDVAGAIQYVNPAFERTTGWTRAEAVKQPFAAIKSGLLDNERSDRVFEALATGKVWQGAYKTKRRGGEVYEEEATFSPIRNGAGDVVNYVVVCRDITEKRRLESIAEAVNMMQNIGYVFSGVRHELGNPINSVKTALSVLRRHVGEWRQEQITTYIERCLSEVGRVEYLLRALKTFSLHENPKMQAVALTEFMQKFVALVEHDFAARGVAVQLASTVEIGAALCDPRALHQIMLNLVANAADALHERDEPTITISLARDERFAHVTIEDNGAGMTDLQIENLFKPFYTSKPDGTGLGLVIVKKMLAQMNGTINFQSAPDVGTKVRFTLETKPE